MTADAMLGKMLPGFARGDVADHGAVDAVLVGKLSLEDAPGCIARPNIGNLNSGQLGLAIPLAAGKQPLVGPVRQVLATGAIKQMIRADARAVIAVVATIIAGGQRAFDEFVGEAMGSDAPGVTEREEAVPVSRSLADPFPAWAECRLMRRDGAVFVDLCPEANVSGDESALIQSHVSIVPFCFTSNQSARSLAA